MTYFKKQTGNTGEDLSAKYLKKTGYKILERNLTMGIGEIDILARKGSTVVIAEVKIKSGKNFGEGYEMVDFKKRQKLLQLANLLHIKYPETVIRIDVISVDLSLNPPKITHFENAVES